VPASLSSTHAIGTPVAEARAPFLGVHQRERPLAAFARTQARGKWKLRIEATRRVLGRAYARGDLGRLRSTDGYPVGRTYLRKLRSFLRGLGYAG
jgi:hypothetical protein